MTPEEEQQPFLQKNRALAHYKHTLSSRQNSSLECLDVVKQRSICNTYWPTGSGTEMIFASIEWMLQRERSPLPHQELMYVLNPAFVEGNFFPIVEQNVLHLVSPEEGYV